ncbi:MAG: PQQ-binding-like beta-propeller repeat protein [Gemmataceae bacterium]|nr:PQQ-binding-like beta-propeller repeat protein [Gemmataceae bacterium]
MSQLSPIPRLLLVGIVFLLGAAIAHADNWPHWRGPDNTGVSKETGVPWQWSESKNVLWTVPMPGRGGSTPVVWNDRIFLTSGDGNDQKLLCINTAGKELWKRVVGSGGRIAIKGDEANEASASPSTDGKYVFAYVGTGHLACFDFEGNEIWKADIQQRYGKFKILHGVHNTPLLHEDRLYVAILHTNGHFVVAIDKKTGDEVWKVERKSDARGECKDAYASPCLWHNGGEICVVVLGCDYATGHRLKDGSEVFRVGDLNSSTKYDFALRIISSPVAIKDLLVVPTARGRTMVAVKPGASGTIQAGNAHEQWRKPKGSPDVPSPLVHDGLVYLCSERGVLRCWEAATGKELYDERLHTDERYRASPVYADGKIYLTSREGNFGVVKAGPKFELLADNVLPDAFTASPVISNGRIYLRGFKTLYAIGK